MRSAEFESTQNNKREGYENQDCRQYGPADQNLFCLSGIVYTSEMVYTGTEIGKQKAQAGPTITES